MNIIVVIKRVSLLAMEPCSLTFPVSSEGGAVEPRYCWWSSSKSLLQVTIIQKNPQKPTQTRQKVIKMRSEIVIERD